MATRLSKVITGTFPQLRYEPTAKRIRASFGGNVVVVTVQAWLVWEPRRITPIFAVPERELLVELAPPELPAAAVEEHAFALRKGEAPTSLDPGTKFGRHTCAGEELDVVTAATTVPRAFHRVDIRASSRNVDMALDGVTLASTTGAQLLYETLLPVRYYLPPSDVRLDLMAESPKRTVCPYKGEASYWSYPESGEGLNIAWSYDRRFRDAAQIHGLISFFNERVDLRVDGVLQPRPVTPWSAPRRDDTPRRDDR